MKKAALLLGLVLGLSLASAQAMDIMSFNRLKYSADSGNVNDMVQLGNHLLNGDAPGGVNNDMAFQYFRKAADRNSPEGMYYAGMCYMYGKGTNLDMTEARQWFERAASRGNRDAERQLSQMPSPQQQQQPSPFQAVMGMGAGAGIQQGGSGGFGSGASSGGFGSGASSGGHHRGSEGDRHFQDMLSRAQQGDIRAQMEVGQMYLNGSNGIHSQPQVAFGWFEKAANGNFGPAMRQLANMYRQGLGVRPNRAEANHWDQMARRNGY